MSAGEPSHPIPPVRHWGYLPWYCLIQVSLLLRQAAGSDMYLLEQRGVNWQPRGNYAQAGVAVPSQKPMFFSRNSSQGM